MSVVSANPKNVSFTNDDEGIRVYTVTIETITDSLDDHARVVCLDVISRWPFGTLYNFGNDRDPWCFARWPKSCKMRSVDKSRKVWWTEVDFSNRPLKKCSEEESGNPIDDPPKISGSFVQAMRAATKDRLGKPITNSSDEPVLPAPEIDDPRDTVIIEFNSAAINLLLRSQYRNVCNSEAVWGLPARSVKVSQWSYDLDYYGQCFGFFRNRMEFQINLDLWNFVHIDQGFRIKNGVDADGNTKYTTLMDDRDQPLREPRLLDGSGGLLAAGGTEYEITDEVLGELPFSALPIPDPLW